MITTPASKAAVAATFTKMLSQPWNKCCIDCGARDPQLLNVRFGCFMCDSCGKFHAAMGMKTSNVATAGNHMWILDILRRVENSGNAYVQAMFFPALPDNMNPLKSEDVASRLCPSFFIEKYEQLRFAVHEGE